MKDKYFLDTNILLYLLSNDINKKRRAKEIFKENHNISIQVLNEFANVSLKKFSLPIKDVKDIIKEISRNSIVYLYDENTIMNALELKNKYSYQFYDSPNLSNSIRE